MAVTIHELEMSLDAANKNSVQLQNSSKQQVIFSFYIVNRKTF